MIDFMIQRATDNPETPDWAVNIIKSIAKTVAEGRPPTPKQYAVIYRNFRSKADKDAIRAIYIERAKAEAATAAE